MTSTGEGGEEPSEYELLLEELLELSEDFDRKSSEETEAVKAAAADAERWKAVETRQKGMETMGKSRKRLAEEKGETTEKNKRRTGDDTVVWNCFRI